MNLIISKAQSRTPVYRRALQEELHAGSTMTVAETNAIPINLPAVRRYRNKVMAGMESDGYSAWTERLLADYGARKSSLSLGGGLGRVEKHLIEIGFCNTIETIELCSNVNGALRVADDNIAFCEGDLNFVEIPSEKYDFILCHGVLHHLINLEFILDQVNRALTRDGILVVYEYIGEDRWQFSEKRREFLRKAFPNVPFAFPKEWQITGFESVRSSDLDRLLQSFFGGTCERQVAYGGVYFPFLTATSADAHACIDRVLQLDNEVSASGALPPCYRMGIYRKATIPNTIVNPWSDAELKRRLAPPSPMLPKIKRQVRRTKLFRKVRSLVRGNRAA